MPHNHGVAPWSGNFYPVARPMASDIMKNNNTLDRDTQMGTWGVVLKPNLKYRVQFTRHFQLKQAVLDSNSFIKQDFHFRVMLVDNKGDQVPLTLCILNKQTLNMALDLDFEEGDDVIFYIKTDLYNMDLNSFSVSLSGKTVRIDEAFERRPSALSTTKSTELIQKNQSSSLPDECYLQNKSFSSPVEKAARIEGASSVDYSPKSASAKLLRAESLHEERTNQKNSGSKEFGKRSQSFKKSFKGGDVLGKLGKYLSKS